MDTKDTELEIIIIIKLKKILEKQGYKTQIIDNWQGDCVRGTKNEQVIDLTHQRKKTGQINVKGHFPKAKKGEYIEPLGNPEINFSSFKTIDEGVKEMQTRFLPVYEEYLANIIQRIKRQEQNIKQQETLLKKLALIIGITEQEFEKTTEHLTRRHEPITQITRYPSKKDIDYVKIKVKYNGDTADINIGITSKHAAQKICKTIKKIMDEKVMNNA